MNQASVRPPRNHPALETLALYAGGDLSLGAGRLNAEWHVRRCADCRETVAGFRQAAAELRDEARTLPSAVELGRSWDSLAREMSANIRLGLAAGEALAPSSTASARRPGWQMLAATAAAVVLAVALFSVKQHDLPAPAKQPPAVHTAAALAPSGARKAFVVTGSLPPRLAATRAGISLESDGGAALTLLHDVRDNSDTIYTSSPDSLRVRYVDAKTGQVRINHVYTE